VPIRPDAAPSELGDAGERAQAERIRHPSARATFVVSRSAQREIIGRYLGVKPGDVPIDRACAQCGDPMHGRPTVHREGFDFSVSHSGDWCLVAVGAAPIGVDLERVGPLEDVAPLVARTLNGFEQAEFAAADQEVQAAAFYRAWSRKEAALKAVGLGMSADLAMVDVRDVATSIAGIALWLRDLDGPEGYAAALASASPIEKLRVFDLSAA
jgi:4'-phosphopantetheinyl transferase